MQPQENPARVLLGLHGNSTEGLLLKNLYWEYRPNTKRNMSDGELSNAMEM